MSPLADPGVGVVPKPQTPSNMYVTSIWEGGGREGSPHHLVLEPLPPCASRRALQLHVFIVHIEPEAVSGTTAAPRAATARTLMGGRALTPMVASPPPGILPFRFPLACFPLVVARMLTRSG